MADVITRLKVENTEYDRKIGQSKRKLDEFGKSGKSAGDALKELSSKMGMSVGSLTKLTGAVGVASVAFNTMASAFKQNEIAMDEWNGTLESAKGVYDGFLNALNTGDISGYLQNINNIVNAARQAYDAIDELGTYNAFNQINVEKASTAFEDAMADFRAGTGSKESVQAAGEEKKKLLRERAELELDTYEAEVRALAAKRGVSGDMLMDALSGKYGDYKKLKAMPLTGKEQRVGTTMYGAPYLQNVTVAANQEEKLGQMLRQLTDDELQGLQALGAQAQRTATEVANVDKQLARVIKEPAGKPAETGAKGAAKDPAIEGTIRYYQEMISGLNKQVGDAVDADVRDQLNNTIRIAKEELSRMQTGESVWGVSNTAATTDETGGNKLATAAGNMDLSGVRKAADDWERYRKNLTAANEADREAANAIGQVGSALQGLENPAAKVMGIVAQAIANVALAAGQAMSAKDTTSSGWAWIGAAAAITGVMATTIAQIKSATAGSYAEGGIIPGNHYSGDQQMAHVNAGELILNRAQQGAIAQQLTSGAERREAQPYLQAETIYLGLNTYLRRTGRGEIVTTR